MAYLPSDFAHPISSFQNPVVPPTTGPLDSPLFQICVNIDWLPFIAGALKQLLLQSTWKSLTDSQFVELQGKVFDLISAFGLVDEGCGSVTPFKMCLSGSFANDDYGYVGGPGAVCPPVYTVGVGWQSCDDGSGNQLLEIRRLLSNSTQIDSYGFTFETGLFAGNESVAIDFYDGGVFQRTDIYTLLTTDRKASSSTPVHADEIRVLCTFVQTIPADITTLTDWKLCYEGAFPLSPPPGASFEHVFDFAAGSQGWFIDSGHGTYTGSEFLSSFNGSDNILRVDLTIASTLQLTAIECIYSTADNLGGTGNLWRAFNGTTLSFGDTVVDGDTVADRHFAKAVTIVGKTDITFSCDAHGSNTSSLKKVILRGIGADPF